MHILSVKDYNLAASAKFPRKIKRQVQQGLAVLALHCKVKTIQDNSYNVTVPLFEETCQSGYIICHILLSNAYLGY